MDDAPSSQILSRPGQTVPGLDPHNVKPRMRRRTLIAFLVAPLWGPVFVMGVYFFISGGNTSASGLSLAAFLLLVSAVLSYAAVLILGPVLYLILQRYGCFKFWPAALCGATFTPLLLFSLHMLDLFVNHWTAVAVFSRDDLYVYSSGAALGFAVGATIWLIARLNRRIMGHD